MPRAKSKKAGLRPKVVECETCGDLVPVPSFGKVPRFCKKHRGQKQEQRERNKTSAAPAASGASTAASSGAAVAMPTAGAPAPALTVWQRRMQRRKQGRPATIACEVCGESVPVAAKAMVPRFCKRHRNNKNRPPVGAVLRAPGAAKPEPVKRGKRGSTLELARQALTFAGLRIARSLDTREGVMILVRRHDDGAA